MTALHTPYKALKEVTSPAIVGMSDILSSSNLPKYGLKGLPLKFNRTLNITELDYEADKIFKSSQLNA